VAAACGGDELQKQLERNEKEYVAPHPESAKVVPASEAVTEKARARSQAVDGVKVRGVVADKDLVEVEDRLSKVHVKEDLPNGAMQSLANH
jgi:CTP synthase